VQNEYKKYLVKMKRMADDIFPKIVAETINTVATFAHVQSARNIKTRFVNRNRYTENSLRYYKANPKAKIEKINAVTGSISDYMDEQDLGGVHKPKQGGKVAMATLYARGGSSTSVKRKKFKLGQNTAGTKFFVGTPRGSNKPVGIYERTNRNKKIRMTHNLEKSSVQIKATSWHRDAVKDRATRSAYETAFIQASKTALKDLGEK